MASDEKTPRPPCDCTCHFPYPHSRGTMHAIACCDGKNIKPHDREACYVCKGMSPKQRRRLERAQAERIGYDAPKRWRIRGQSSWGSHVEASSFETREAAEEEAVELRRSFPMEDFEVFEWAG